MEARPRGRLRNDTILLRSYAMLTKRDIGFTQYKMIVLKLGIESVESLLLTGGHQSPVLAIETAGVECGSISSLNTPGILQEPGVLAVDWTVEPDGMV